MMLKEFASQRCLNGFLAETKLCIIEATKPFFTGV